MSSITLPQQDAVARSYFYRAVWRWHFYAGLFVAPFLTILAVSGLVILFVTGVAPEYGEWLKVTPGPQTLSVSEQVDKALAAEPGSTLGKYVTPWGADRPALVEIKSGDVNRMLAVDPYSGTILRDTVEAGTWKAFMSDVHGKLLLGGDGGPGDFLIETAASLGIIVLATGLYLWWPRDGRGVLSSLLPNLALRGRALWRSLHQSVGAGISVVLLFFLISGLSWAGVWGGKFVQAWSTFPAAKWDNVPLSDATHASMNHDSMKEVPWTLEQAPMPESGSSAGITGVPHGTAVAPQSLVALGRDLGFEGRFQVTAPAGDTGVWTLSQDSMSYDSANPTADRTVHVDQYTGQVLADVRFADYPLAGKLMAVGIALHEGQLGWWNVVLNALFCLLVIFSCVSGVVMWWKRRPAGEFAAPRYPRQYRLGIGVAIIAVILGLAFPLGGAALLLFAAIDTFLPRRLKEAGAHSA
ncbi:PepSY-associated TM helix domain-containing protein [Aestuariivirga sp.]|uniref:PepSY-associated TM helix domain-containing protein n=1 Tax=Aestuariivirga sp. TaxID=2650926 RepID=UPI003BAB5C57